MESLKLFIFVAFLFLGILAQRFQRHSKITNDTQNDQINNNNFIDNFGELAADVSPGVQDGDDVRLIEYGKIDVELLNGQLEFEICSDGCRDKTVVVCYDAQNIVSSLQTGCSSNQCNFEAGVSTAQGHPFLWFIIPTISKGFTENICETAVLRSPKPSLSFVTSTPTFSCEPLKRNGNVITLVVKEHECPLIVKNAKIWSATTPSATTQPSATPSSEDSKVGSIVWIVLGVVLFILIIGLISLGIYCFCIKKQKKAAEIFDKKPNEILADKKKIETQKINVEPDAGKTKDAKKESTDKKKETVEEKPSKQKNEIKNVPAKKNAAAGVERTLDEATTEVSVVQKPKEKDHYPSARVSKELILPVPKSAVKKMKPRNGGSNKTDSLSGRHEVGMLGLVESPSESLKRLCNATGSDNLIDEKLERYYQPGDIRILRYHEIYLFCCTISSMFKQTEDLIEMAEEELVEHDVKFDDNGNVIEMTQKAHQYLEKKSTPEFIRSFAFGQIYRELLDAHVGILDILSIPLLFVIVLQRRYTVLNRRKACAWMRRQMPIVQKEFSLKERSKLPYPINAIEEAFKINPEYFNNTSLLNTRSGMEEDETQKTTHESDKRAKKESGGGKKKKTKKHHSKK